MIAGESQQSELAVARVRDLADALVEEFGAGEMSDFLAMQSLVQGTVEFCETQRLEPRTVAGEFLMRLREWIEFRDEEEAEAIRGRTADEAGLIRRIEGAVP